MLMRLTVVTVLATTLSVTSAQANEWRVEHVDTPARVTAIETVDGKPYVNAGGLWYSIEYAERGAKLTFVDMPPRPKQPEDALPDGRVAKGTRNIARVWLSEPTTRYDHGILGDAIEAGALTIETRDGKLQTLRLKDDAVFEDLKPRLADLDGDGHDEVIVVKSYIKRGSALTVVGLRKGRDLGRYDILAESPPLGGPHRWLNPAGIADFTGDGKLDIALVRQPHAIGELELWRYADGKLRKTASLPGYANHIAGTRALAMSAIADFNGDGITDLALPSLDRAHLRIVSFVPNAHDIAGIALPSKAATNLAAVAKASGPPPIASGLADGTLVLIRND
jgi:hypothetical protein